MNYQSPSGRAVKAVRLRLADRGETIEQLAAATGIAHSTLKRRLQGLSPFTIDELDVIAEHFGVPIMEVLRSPLEAVAS